MVSTPNYQLLQPDAADFVNVVTQLNDNYTKIDQDMNRYDIQIFTAAGTWTKPARCKRVRVRVIGGGGSGGACPATGAATLAVGGGGGGGGYSEKLFLATALSATETVDVGAGGALAAAGGNNGNAGGTSKFATGKAYEVNATGGAGGAAGFAAGGFFSTDSGAGGVGAGGDINATGSVGGKGLVLSTTSAFVNNYGGGSVLGGNTPYAGNNSSGNAGQKYGSGSSGAFNNVSQAARAGVVGGDGIVIVENWY